MSRPIASISGLGKRYRLQHKRDERYVTLRDALASALTAPFRWLSSTSVRSAQAADDFWALQDVTFDVARGEVVGIIGRNGAGKSTLLKILSRITEPTTGRVTLDGRVASLLEVGTGFHGELSGRENIFLNGAILGMTGAEIARKFDAIVAFAEVERFLDTPVKRYSSGMYVRLAFAVAAHLEPEILIVDEVLAVGDAVFQKKSLGTMREASQGGRTVLFVSHNMAAVASLTTRCLVLQAGRVVFDGPTPDAIAFYSEAGNRAAAAETLPGRGQHTTIVSAQLVDEAGTTLSHYTPGEPLRLSIEFDTDGTSSLSLEAFLVDPDHHRLGLASLHQFHGVMLPERAGRFQVVIEFAAPWLAAGIYTFDLATSVVNSAWDHYVETALEFEVLSANPGGASWDFQYALGYGSLALPCTKMPRFVPAQAPNAGPAVGAPAES